MSESPNNDDSYLIQKCLCSRPPNPKGRRLIVAFDGTENQFSEKSSHVVELYSRVIKDEHQKSYYNSGIGTYSKPSRTARVRIYLNNKWASVNAWNLKSNILAGYRWLSDNYQEGDHIFLFGFSRGAYQVRVLAAMIHKVGLICAGNEEQIPFCFDIYKDSRTSTNNVANKFKQTFCREVGVHFVGVWDTVSSVGILTHKEHPEARSADHICFFRHALALDERRVKFLPEYVKAQDESFRYGGTFGQPRCKEVWFQGSHSDIGGGRRQNPDLNVGGVPSRWMAHEAMLAGLQLKPVLQEFGWSEIKSGDISDSMTMFYRTIEYILPVRWDNEYVSPPRATRALHGCRGRIILENQKIHASVLFEHDDSKPYKPAANLHPKLKVGWADILNKVANNQSAITVEDPSAYHSRTSPAIRETLSKAVSQSLSPKMLTLDTNATNLSVHTTEEAQHNKITNSFNISNAKPLDPGYVLSSLVEWDLFDLIKIPVLVDGISNKSNEVECFQRLNGLAFSEEGRARLCQIQHQYLLDGMESDDLKIVELSLRLARKLFFTEWATQAITEEGRSKTQDICIIITHIRNVIQRLYNSRQQDDGKKHADLLNALMHFVRLGGLVVLVGPNSKSSVSELVNWVTGVAKREASDTDYSHGLELCLTVTNDIISVLPPPS